ncbi:MAG: hypothetical protein JO166_12780 [Deltaproteobacteria bacterium]|nr:hypothetical protein [Deltaproteobacteria bacterium]
MALIHVSSWPGDVRAQSAQRVFAAGVPKENAEVARRMGFEPFPTIEAALQEAEARLGKSCSITYHPHLEEQTYFTRVHINRSH